MRNFCFCLFCFLLITGCGSSSSDGEPSAEESKAVKVAIKKLTDFYSDKKTKALKEILADEPEPVVYNILGEIWKGKETIIKKLEKVVEKVEDSNIEARDLVIKIIGDVAWISQRGDWGYDYDGQHQKLEGVRMTGVLLKQGGDWKFVQWHVSYPVRTGGEQGQQNQLYQQQMQQQLLQQQQQIQQQYDQQNEQWRQNH